MKIYHTIKHLKFIQIKYQLWYRLKHKLGIKNEGLVNGLANQLSFVKSCATPKSYFGNNHFVFLNIDRKFTEIDWNYEANGKLWVYNLNYFDYLNQESISKEDGLKLIRDFSVNYRNIKDGQEPYPTSLRIINFIKFISKYKIRDNEIDDIVRKDTFRLMHSLEYHLLGNHLLENAFALTLSGYYLSNEGVKQKAITLLRKEMKEQILKDGAHFELSPMYHQLMTYRVLDVISMLEEEDKLRAHLITYVKRMLSWIKQISFENGDIPYVNDSAVGIVPTTSNLIHYAQELGINKWDLLGLKESGYRKKVTDNYEILIDVGHIGPSYQPGHAHADTLQFVLYAKNRPFLVDMGTSTYTIGERRTEERASFAHNVVTVNGLNSSHVWSGFRVAKRAKIVDLIECSDYLSASHNGYKSIGVDVNRTWLMKNDSVEIFDNIGTSQKGILNLHFHDDVDQLFLREKEIVTNMGTIKFKGKLRLELKNYELAKGMNKTNTAIKAVIYFEDQLTTNIYFCEN